MAELDFHLDADLTADRFFVLAAAGEAACAAA